MILLMPEKRLTVHEAAQRMERNPLLVYRWIGEGRLHAERYVRSLLITERELQRFLKNEPQRRRGKKGGR